MVTALRPAAFILGGLLWGATWPMTSLAFANVQVGETVENASLKTLDGKRHDLLAKKALANVFIFFRPKQDHSVDTLKWMAECEKEFASKPVHWVAIVSDTWALEDVKATVDEAKINMPVLVDEGDALYGKLGVRLHPVIGIVDAKGKLTAYEPFREINYCDRLRADIRYTLGEITLADVEKVDNPEKATTRTEEGVAKRHLNFAKQLLRIQMPDKALEEVKKSLEHFPTAAGWALQGKILVSQGHCADALPAFDAALKIDPKESSALEGRKGCGR